MSKKNISRKLPLGIDVGSNSIKIVQLAKSAKGFIVSAYGELAIPGYASGSEKAVFLKEGLKKIFHQNKFKKSHVSLLVPASDACVRIFTIPAMSKDEVPEAVKWTSKRYIAHPLDEMVLSFAQEEEVVEQNVKKIKISFLGVHKNIYQIHTAYAGTLGLKVFSMNTSCHAIKNLISTYSDLSQKAVMVLNMGCNSTDIIILFKSQLIFTRNIPEGGKGFDEAIVENLSLGEKNIEISSTVAKDIKHKFGLLLEDTNEIHNGIKVWDATSAMNNHLDRIVRELQLSLSHFRQLSHGSEIEEVVLTGGGAKVLNMDKILSEKINLPVNYLSHFASSLTSNLDDLETYASSIGAALEMGNNPNLLLNIQKISKKKTTQGSKVLKKIAVVFGALLLILFLGVGGFYFFFQGRIQYYRRRLNSLQSKSIAIEELTSSVKALNLRKKLMRTISDSESPMIEVIIDLSQIVDSNRMVVESIDFDPQADGSPRFKIKGKILSGSEADSMDIISEFLSGLEKTEHFSSLSPKITERSRRDSSQQSYINFEVSCIFKNKNVEIKAKQSMQWQNPILK